MARWTQITTIHLRSGIDLGYKLAAVAPRASFSTVSLISARQRAASVGRNSGAHSAFRRCKAYSLHAGYSHNLVPGGTFFFTLNFLDRRSDLLVAHVDVLREAVRRTRMRAPFGIDA